MENKNAKSNDWDGDNDGSETNDRRNFAPLVN